MEVNTVHFEFTEYLREVRALRAELERELEEATREED